jgi:hypothetical protein
MASTETNNIVTFQLSAEFRPPALAPSPEPAAATTP